MPFDQSLQIPLMKGTIYMGTENEFGVVFPSLIALLIIIDANLGSVTPTRENLL